jgi:acetate kinase
MSAGHETTRKRMKVLIMNCGSSSMKFQLLNMANEHLLAKGLIERIGSSDAIINYQTGDGANLREIREVLDHTDAIEIIIALLLHAHHGVLKRKEEIEGIGHRVVHGGEAFFESVLINETVKAAIKKFIQFAPLHNPPNLKGIEVCERLLPNVPQVAVFDTAFHYSIPPRAYIYGLPYAIYTRLGIRRYGFHGTSHRFVSTKAAEVLGKAPESVNCITCHLGNGASVTAVEGGKSVDMSMGFTPLEGLVMGTRCGDIDPALIPYLMEKENLNAKQIDSMMNKNSGMLGLTGTSNDMREILAEAARGSEQHKLAVDIYCYRVRKYIGAYFAVLGRVDALVFTGGIGENAALIRELTLRGLEPLGVVLDAEKNKNHQLDIGTGPVRVLVIPTNEELAIGRDTAGILSALQRPGEKHPAHGASAGPCKKPRPG